MKKLPYGSAHNSLSTAKVGYQIMRGKSRRASRKLNWKKLGRVFVAIDAANLEKSAQDLGWKVHYRRLRRFFQENTELLDIKFYTVAFETPRHRDFLSSLTRLNYGLVTKPLKLIRDKRNKSHKRKANFDVEIAVDTIEYITKFDSLVLFSGDSDFHYLVTHLQVKGKKAVVVSFRGHVSVELVRSADWYVPLTSIPGVLKQNHPGSRRGK